MKIKQIDPRIERNRIILELYDYIENYTNMQAPTVCAYLYKNLNKRVQSRQDFIDFFSDDSNLVVGIGEKSLKVIREFFGITKVTTRSTRILFRPDIKSAEDINKARKKKILLVDIRKYLNNNCANDNLKNTAYNAVARAMNTYNITTKEELKNLIYKSNIKVRGIGPKSKEVLTGYFYK